MSLKYLYLSKYKDIFEVLLSIVIVTIETFSVSFGPRPQCDQMARLYFEYLAIYSNKTNLIA